MFIVVQPLAEKLISMPQRVAYILDETTPRMTADAFRVRLRQSSFAVQSERKDGDEVELVSDGVTLWLFIEDGFVAEIEGEVKFADDRRSTRLLELIESMGWVPVEE